MYVNNKFPPPTPQYDDNDKKGNRTPTTPQSLPPQTPPPQSPPCATTTNGDDNDQVWVSYAKQAASKNQRSKCSLECKDCHPNLPSPEPEPESKPTDESDNEWQAVTDSGTLENSQNSEEGPKEES